MSHLPRRPVLTDRLVLEPAGTTHAPALYQEVSRSRSKLAPWLAWASGSRFEDVLGHLAEQEEAWATDTGYGFAILLDRVPVGHIALRRTHSNRAEGSIGYWIGEAAGGQGHMTEATQAVVEFGFRAAGLQRIEIRAHVENRASWRVAEKAGARREGRLRMGAGTGDAYVYGVLPGDPRVDRRHGDDRRPESAAAVTEPDFARGLVTAVVQDELDGAVLMVAHMNEEAWARTRDTGRAWFWSRSREALWEKGESSGNRLEVTSIALDCDGDAVLLRVVPSGPACHTGARTCFHNPV